MKNKHRRNKKRLKDLKLESMAMRGNPLALSALVEGVKVVSSKRVDELSRKLSETYTRRGRMWIPR